MGVYPASKRDTHPRFALGILALARRLAGGSVVVYLLGNAGLLGLRPEHVVSTTGVAG